MIKHKELSILIALAILFSGIMAVMPQSENSEGESVVIVSPPIYAIEVSRPPCVFLNSLYDACIPVTATTEGDIQASIPSWLSTEFIATPDKGNYLVIKGTFSDETLVNSSFRITVISSGELDEWTVFYEREYEGVTVSYDCEKVDGDTVRIRYTGTVYNSISLHVQWISGFGYVDYEPSPDGWMYHDYDSEGVASLALTVSVILDDQEYTSTKIIPISTPVVQQPNTEPDTNPVTNPDQNNGTENNGDGDDLILGVGIGVAITAIIALFGFFIIRK